MQRPPRRVFRPPSQADRSLSARLIRTHLCSSRPHERISRPSSARAFEPYRKDPQLQALLAEHRRSTQQLLIEAIDSQVGKFYVQNNKESQVRRRILMRFTKWPALILGSFLLVSEASATAQVVVPGRPPHSRFQRRGRPPGRGFVWVPGFQRWDGRGYVWTPGSWQRPPRG